MIARDAISPENVAAGEPTPARRVRVGLMRHFPVVQQFPTGWRTSADLGEWLERYDAAEVAVGKFDLGGISWQTCIASDLPRARITAQTVFAGDPEYTPLLREPRFAPFRTGNLRLPVWVWWRLLQFSWLSGHSSQRVCRDEFVARVLAVADRLSVVDRDILVVSHAGMMAYLSAELRRRGFAGPKLHIANHATTYIYEKGE